MNRQLYLTCSFLLFSSVLFGQKKQFFEYLAGYQLGQFAEVPENEMGEIISRVVYPDGIIAKAYYGWDSSFYMVFEYLPGDTSVIWSIQITGLAPEQYIGLADLQLGLTENEVYKALGKPTKKKDIGEYGTLCTYKTKNVSYEINTEGLLSSIKIVNRENEYWKKVLVNKEMADFSYTAKLFSDYNVLVMDSIVSGSCEIYKTDESFIYYFNFCKITEDVTDNSTLYAQLSAVFTSLQNMYSGTEIPYFGFFREKGPNRYIYVWQFEEEDAPVREIVWRWEMGKFRIWEIRY